MTSHTDGLIPTRGKTFQTGENTKKTVSEITEKKLEAAWDRKGQGTAYIYIGVSGNKVLQVLAIKKDLRNMGFKGVSMRLAGECAWHTPLAAHTVTLLISESAHVSKSFFMPENQ